MTQPRVWPAVVSVLLREVNAAWRKSFRGAQRDAREIMRKPGKALIDLNQRAA